MIITCEKCYAKFNLDENLLKHTGSKVRCSKCQNIFLAYPPVEMERPVEPAEEMVGSETVDSDVEAESVELPEPEVEEELEEVEKPLEADVETEEAPITTEKETKPVEKKRISVPVLIALIIALLAGGAYGTYVVLKSMNIKIPFISDLTKPVVQDVGNLKIIAFDITDKFIDNSKVGKLFIISGKVKNEYSGAHSFIRVTGKLYAKGKILSKSVTVYCGNVLSDQDLSNMDINSINKKLANRLGDNKSNVNVKPGKLLPFMIVFPNIPDNIEKSTVEVAGSSPA